MAPNSKIVLKREYYLNVMHNDFKLVKKRKRNQKKQFELSGELHTSPEAFIKGKLNKAVEEFKSSHFCFELFQAIDSGLKSIKSPSVNEILCLGLGNFTEGKSSLHQLAALLVFHEKYNSSVKVYDPVFSVPEIEILKDLSFEVLVDNQEGKNQILDNIVTLVFLPHCPKQLTNNFLWANWSLRLTNCILISNSFGKIIEGNTTKALKESAEYILKIHPKTTEVVLENNYNIENIFNDLSVHYFNSSELDNLFFAESLGTEPIYIDNTELITKIKSLEIKNE